MFLLNLAHTQRLAAERASFIEVATSSRIKTETHTHYEDAQDAWEYPLWNRNPSPLSVSDYTGQVQVPLQSPRNL